jgi:hypothetical protein
VIAAAPQTHRSAYGARWFAGGASVLVLFVVVGVVIVLRPSAGTIAFAAAWYSFLGFSAWVLLHRLTYEVRCGENGLFELRSVIGGVEVGVRELETVRLERDDEVVLVRRGGDRLLLWPPIERLGEFLDYVEEWNPEIEFVGFRERG